MIIAGHRPGDRNLLFGVLAMQLDFVGQSNLVTAMQAWMLDHSKSLGEVLEQSGQLTANRRKLLDELVEEHLALHKADANCGLAEPSSLEVAQQLLRLADTNLMADSPPAATMCLDADPHRTIAVEADERHSRYSVLRPLGRGGLGLVWAALDRELHREVALKEIQPRLADDKESRLRFQREAEITGGLEHPGIVPVYGLGAYPDGRLFYAMRLIRGESLLEAIVKFHSGIEAERGVWGPQYKKERFEQAGTLGFDSLEFRKLLKPFIDACNAIAYAHSRGVLHRDIKPDNIMLGRFGETLVVDWGLAKMSGQASPVAAPVSPADSIVNLRHLDDGPLRLSEATSSAAETQMGSTLGTPQYMSPEQADGRLDLVGPASDVYGLGATLYALLTGQAPCAGSDARETLEQVRRSKFPTPRQARRDVPAALEAVCLKAMSRIPGERYATASELADELERWLADEPVRAYQEPWRQRISRWSRRHRAWTLAGAMVLVVVAFTATLATGVVTHAWNNEAWALEEVSRHLEKEQQDHDRAVQARREADAAREAADEAQSELARQITMLGLEDRLQHCARSKPLLWEISADRIAPLYERLRVPTGNDLSMQSWPAFRATCTDRLAGRNAIYLVQIGELSIEQQALAHQTGEFLSCFFAQPVRWLEPVVQGDLTHAISIEQAISSHRPKDAIATLGITNADLGSTRFCDQQAASREAVVSLARLTSPGSAQDNHAVLLRRLLKVALTAVSRAVGIRDFAAFHCGMNPATDLASLDDKPLEFCPECEQKVWWLCNIEPAERYQRLIEFADEHHLTTERKHWQRMLDAIRTPHNEISTTPGK